VQRLTDLCHTLYNNNFILEFGSTILIIAYIHYTSNETIHNSSHDLPKIASLEILFSWSGLSIVVFNKVSKENLKLYIVSSVVDIIQYHENILVR
jgi:hypothetical protein